MTCITYSRPGPTFLPSGPVPEDLWQEITLEQAARWFISCWKPSSDEEGQSMPPEIRDQIAGTDIDGPTSGGPGASEAKGVDPSTDSPTRAPKSKARAKAIPKRMHVI